MRRLILGLTMAVVVLASPVVFGAADDEKPKYTISEVMLEGHKKGLMKKVATGKGEKADKDKLLEMYEALVKNKPPKGEAKDWKTKTEALVKAAKAVAADEKDAGKQLQKAANCKMCHDAHR